MIFCCAACQARLEVVDEAAQRGAKVRCPKCSAALMIHKDLAPQAPLFDAISRPPKKIENLHAARSLGDDLFAGIDPGVPKESKERAPSQGRDEGGELFANLGLDLGVEVSKQEHGLHELGGLDLNDPELSLKGPPKASATRHADLSSPFEEFDVAIPEKSSANKQERSEVRKSKPNFSTTCIWAVRRYGPRVGSVVGAVTVGLFGAAMIAWTINGYLDAREKEKAALVVQEVTQGFYETREGRSVFLVHGKVVNRSLESKKGVKVVVELLQGSKTSRVVEGMVGSVPSPEELYSITSVADNEALMQKLASESRPVHPADSTDFGVVFYEYPDDISDHSVRITVVDDSNLGAKSSLRNN